MPPADLPEERANASVDRGRPSAAAASEPLVRASLSQVADTVASLQRSAVFDRGDTHVEPLRTLDWTAGFAEAVDAVRPGNLRALEDAPLLALEQAMLVDGIALYGVPRPGIAERLLAADDTAARRDELGSSWEAVSADCRGVLERCRRPEIARYRVVALGALDALDGGADEAAQALAGSLVDHLIRQRFGRRRRAEPGASAEERAGLDLADHLAYAPLWRIYQPYRTGRVPRGFNRHATARTVSALQYSRRSALQGLMFVTGIILREDERARLAQPSLLDG